MPSSKLHKLLNDYLDSWIILAIDLLISTGISAITILGMLVFRELSLRLILCYTGFAFVASLLSFYLLKTYKAIIRHISFNELGGLFNAVLLKELLVIIFLNIFSFFTRVRPSLSLSAVLFLADASLTICLLIFVRLLMIKLYNVIKFRAINTHQASRVLIYGISDKSVALVGRLEKSPHYKVIGFVTCGETLKDQRIATLPIYSLQTAQDFAPLAESHKVAGLLFSNDKDLKNEQENLVKLCIANGGKVFLSPAIDDVVDGRIMKSSVREIRIEDLLGRKEIEISLGEIQQKFKGNTVMITGAAGSIGSEICRQLALIGVGKLILFDNAETPMHNLRLELEGRFPGLDFVPVIGDVRYEQRLNYVFQTYHPVAVIHAAAYKHVPLMEENPCEAVLVNVGGTRNLALKCIEYGVRTMVMISTDKAVNPTNIMGCSKRLAEIYVQSLGLELENGGLKGETKFVTTRFGNVLGSNGSVIPRFKEQIDKGGPVTVTHPEINRFFMTIPEACRLVLEATTLTKGNQIFVFDMGESVKIDTLARRMIELAGLVPDKDIKIEYTGLRPGEKLYEEVLSNSENTSATTHQRIRIAKVREYAYTEAEHVALELCELAREVRIPEMVMLMKRTVPEFKSKNSIFEKYDK